MPATPAPRFAAKIRLWLWLFSAVSNGNISTYDEAIYLGLANVPGSGRNDNMLPSRPEIRLIPEPPAQG